MTTTAAPSRLLTSNMFRGLGPGQMEDDAHAADVDGVEREAVEGAGSRRVCCPLCVAHKTPASQPSRHRSEVHPQEQTATYPSPVAVAISNRCSGTRRLHRFLALEEAVDARDVQHVRDGWQQVAEEHGALLPTS